MSDIFVCRPDKSGEKRTFLRSSRTMILMPMTARGIADEPR